MALKYTNRKGDAYYLHEGKTKSGKPKYYTSRKAEGTLAEQMPEGFEFYEEPERALVTVRKTRPTRLLPAERANLDRWIRELAGTAHFTLETDGDNFVIYTSSTSTSESMRIAGMLAGPFGGRTSNVDWLCQMSPFQAMMRFKLVDEEKRRFSVYRWCFKGSIDDWFPLNMNKPLEELAREYLPHLANESFFELF